MNMDLNQVLTTGVLGAAAAGMVKACPPSTRLRATLGLGGLWSGVSIMNNYLNSRVQGTSGGFGGSNITSSTGVGVSPSPANPSGSSEASGVTKYIIEELSKILGKIKEIILGEPINCEGRTNPVDKINDLLTGFTEEEKFFIGVILLLLVTLYTSLAIMTSIIIRFVFNKPFNNKYMEIIRIR